MTTWMSPGSGNTLAQNAPEFRYSVAAASSAAVIWSSETCTASSSPGRTTDQWIQGSALRD